MKKTYIQFLILFIFVNSCKKDKTDSIQFTDLESMIEVSSVDTLILHGSGCGYVPSPSDSIASINIDINNDGTDDFNLKCSSWYHFVSASGPCANYNTSIIISGISANKKIATSGDYNKIKTFQSNEEVSLSSQWLQTSSLMMESVEIPFTTNFSGDRYIGLKIKQGQDDNFAWLYLNKTGYTIKIISYAFNQTKNNSIRAGQIE